MSQSEQGRHVAERPHGRRAAPRTKLLAIPVALVAATSMLFGSQAANATPADKPERPLNPDTDNEGVKLPRGGAIVRSEIIQYVVTHGDNLREIAATHGVSTAELLAANGLSWRTMIQVGQTLTIPSTTAGHTAEALPNILRHQVAAGDTLEAISRVYSVQPRALMTANGLDRTSRLVVGQRLVIPDASIMGGLPALQASAS